MTVKTDEQERDDLAVALRLAAHFDLNEGVCNHFSLQLDDTRFLLNPHGIHWSRITADDILLLDQDGNGGDAEVTAFSIHAAVHARHPAARCVLHTHMPHATALACLAEPALRFISQASLRFYDDVAWDHDYNGLAETPEEGARIASALDHRRVLFLANHGVIVTGASIAEAFDRLYYLERACQVQVLAMSTGQALNDVGANLAMKTRAEIDAGSAYAEAHFDALKPLVALP